MFDFIIAGYRSFFLFLSGSIGIGWAVVALSLLCSFLMAPLMKAVAGIVRRETEYQSVILPQVAAIKERYSSDIERNLHISALYARYSYSPLSAVKKVLPLFVQIPFLLLTYFMLKGTPQLSGVSFLILKDLGSADALAAGFNLLPFVMTGINLVTVLATPGFEKRDMVQAVGVALLFLVMLYTAPSALLLYWTLNNAITCVRTLVAKRFEGLALLWRRMRLLRKLPDACVFCFSWSSIQFAVVMMFLLCTYFSIILFFSSDIRASLTYTVAKWGVVAAPVLVVAMVLVKVLTAHWTLACRYFVESVNVFAKTLMAEGYWLMIPMAFAIHYSFSSADVSLTFNSVSLMLIQLTWPCIAFAVVLIFLFRRFLCPNALLKLSIAFFSGVYIVPMVSISGDGFRGAHTNIFLRLFVVAAAVLASLAIRKKSIGLVFSAILLGVSLFHACMRMEFAQYADVRRSRNRVVDALGTDVHCVKSNNVYFLVYDSYAHRTVLNGLELRNGNGIETLLKENGFTVYDAYSTGRETIGSMSRTFTINGIAGENPRMTIAGDNVFCDFLKTAGYKMSFLLSGYTMPSQGKKAGHYYFPTEVRRTDNVVLNGIFSGCLTQNAVSFNSFSYREWLEAYHKVMKSRASSGEFIYAHSPVLFHAPYELHHRKADEQQRYEKRLMEADKAILRNLELLKADKDAVIIVASDHGGYLTKPKKYGQYDFRNVLDCHGILLAIRWPKDYVPCLEINCLQNVFLEVMIYLSGNRSLSEYKNSGRTCSIASHMQTPEGLVENGLVTQGKHKGESIFDVAKMEFGLPAKSKIGARSVLVDFHEANFSSANLHKVEGESIIKCVGVLGRSWSDSDIGGFIAGKQYIGARFPVSKVQNYSAIVFEGKRQCANGQPTLVLVEKNGNVRLLYYDSYHNLDMEWHTHVVYLPAMSGDVEIILNGGYTDRSGSKDSCYLFKNVRLIE